MRSPPTASPPAIRIGTSALARCWVEPIRPVAPLTMMPMVLVGIDGFRCAQPILRFFLNVARRRLRREAAAAAREGILAALVPGAVDSALREHIPGRIPVAEGVAVPRRARREPRQAELVPDG